MAGKAKSTAKTTAIPPRLRRLQAFDRALGPALCRWWPARARSLGAGKGGVVPADGVRRALVIRPGGLGDAVLMRPMLHALAAAFPAARIDVLAERRNAAALRIGVTPFDVICYDDGIAAVLRRLRASGYDLVIDTEQYHHLSVLLANALRPRWLCGFDTFGRGRFQTHPVPHDEETYEAISFLRLAEAVTGRRIPFDPERSFLEPGAADFAWADQVLMAGSGRPLAVLMPGAGGAYRLWAPERFAEIGRWLAGRGYHLVVLGGADAVTAGRMIAAGRAPGAITDLTGRSTLAQTAAVLARSRLAVSADTGVLHLAYAVGTPTVGLFGPGLHRKWAPPGSRHRTVRKGLACSPCIHLGRLPDCPYEVACMRDITVAEVIAAIEALPL
jgi:ADP-heptose:LPS heptosyltransferase